MKYLYLSIGLFILILFLFSPAITSLPIMKNFFEEEVSVTNVNEQKINSDLIGRVSTLQEKNPIIREIAREFQVYMVENLDDILILVNKERALPEDYVPSDLVEPDVLFSFDEPLPQRLLRQEAAEALEELFEAAAKENIHLFAVSGFRSFERQQAIFAFNWETHGEERANQYSARAGHSEHQTGLAMDITSQSVNFQISTSFGETEEGIWVKENAAKFGFIIRYPEGKEEITGYHYEPWHLRYVGIDAAMEIEELGITLDEYILGY
ncbi:D-alanyl-D-alanine carboxypeptidase [Evansella vedderi]|uniref:D-alanyl-D-alanine carboxypeptidase n=1 Tax=Evansella vedderi TaxID=38282 RepID=A0ABT9ZX79_9BACI|nr:M15 family metallopeptidase [Evansella vedderi]MDQ0254740.1 D-alanyl-D-alanine carboxypeptidase [Evansella vedderi]